MILATVLVAYASFLGWVVDIFLTRSAWVTRSPRAALHLWHASVVGFLLGVAGSLVVVEHDVLEHSLMWLLHADKGLLHLAYSGSNQVDELWNVSILLLAATTTLFICVAAKKISTAGRERSAHRVMATMQPSQESPNLNGVSLVDHAAAAVYCVPGRRGENRILVTSGAYSLLTPDQLSAVIEHERTHLRHRHHGAIMFADIVHTLLGWSGVLRHYPQQVRRLSEMVADDCAAKRWGDRAVATALLKMCTVSTPEQGHNLVAMTGADPAERIRRLLADSRSPNVGPFPRLVSVAAATLALFPLAAILTPAARIAGSVHAEQAASEFAKAESQNAPVKPPTRFDQIEILPCAACASTWPLTT